MLINSAAEKALTSYLKISQKEKGLLLYDDSTDQIARAFEESAKKLKLNLHLLKIPPTGGNGVEPSDDVAQMMKEYDVVIAPTCYSLTHTDATRNAVKEGARVATLPGINSAIFAEGLLADPEELHTLGAFWVKKLEGKRTIRITSEQGTDITFTTGNYLPMNDDGILRTSGIFGNLPAGEAFIAPDENSANGVVVFDGTIGGQGGSEDITSPVTIILKDGFIVDFVVDSISNASRIRTEKLKDTLMEYGDSALMLAEFGIGTNPNLKMSGNLLGDEKLIGTIHLAFGNNCSMGGKNNVKVHIDCLVTNPNIYIDGERSYVVIG